MKLKSFVVAGLVAVTVSPAIADGRIPYGYNPETGKSNDTEVQKVLDELEKEKKDAEKKEAIKAQMAAMDKELRKCRSARGYWVDGETCIEKNPCNSTNASVKNKYCVEDFNKIKVASPEKAGNIVTAYVTNKLKWEGCSEMYVPGKQGKKMKAGAGHDFIACTKMEEGVRDVRVFEFANISKKNEAKAETSYTYAMCITLGGKMQEPKKVISEAFCSGLKKDQCEDVLYGSYDDDTKMCTIAII